MRVPMKELVSVIIPVYNVQDYLQTCLDSVCNQTYTNMEIILVDDGSTDNSGRMCDRYATEDTRIRVIHKTNGGQSSARNLGIDIAQGQWLTFVDSDDLVAPDLIERLIQVVDDADMAMCDRQKFTDMPNVAAQPGVVEQYDNLSFLNKIYDAPRFIAIWGKLYKRSLFQEFRFSEGIIYEDEDALPQLIYASKKIVYLQEEKYFYRVRPGSTMNSSFSKKQLDIIEVCQRRIELFTQWQIEDLRTKAVKDYYYHLKRLEKQTSAVGMEQEHSYILGKMKQWPAYGVRFGLFERLRQWL